METKSESGSNRISSITDASSQEEIAQKAGKLSSSQPSHLPQFPDNFYSSSPDDKSNDWDGIPRAEDFMPSAKKIPGPLNRFPTRREGMAAIWFYGACWLLSLWSWSAPNGISLHPSRQTVFEDNEWHRLITGIFIHSDVSHILSNGPLLLIFGWFLRAFFGRLVFPGISLLIGVLAHGLTLLHYPGQVRLLGASGMVYGMVGLWLVFYMTFETDRTFSEKLMRCLGFSLVVLAPTTFNPETSYAAHGYGFALGLVGGFLLRPWIRLRS